MESVKNKSTLKKLYVTLHARSYLFFFLFCLLHDEYVFLNLIYIYCILILIGCINVFFLNFLILRNTFVCNQIVIERIRIHI